MNELDAVSMGAMVTLGMILLVLLLQVLRIREALKMLIICHRSALRGNTLEMENKELRSALRAEREHVEQLRGKIVILQKLVPAV